MKDIPHCPPKYILAKRCNAFRFVFEDLNDSRNFAPVYVQNPARRNNAAMNANICIGYGLSFFNTLEKAREGYKAIRKLHKNIHKTIGTHLASGTITPTDGKITEPGPDGHLTLFESTTCNLVPSFSAIEKLYDGQD